MAKVAVLGLGIMGIGMAHNLLRAGHTVAVYNRTRARGKPLQAEGAHIAASPFDAAQDAVFVISMVAEDNASRAVWLGEQGALAAAKSGALLVESSTLSPGWIRELAQLVKQRGADLLDAPVTGSKSHAQNGEPRISRRWGKAALESVPGRFSKRWANRFTIWDPRAAAQP